MRQKVQFLGNTRRVRQGIQRVRDSFIGEFDLSAVGDDHLITARTNS
jgi:hypothetical protein